MPRPKVDRVTRSMRLRSDIDARLVRKAKAEGLSINAAVEQAVLAWTAAPTRTTPRRSRQVQPRFK